MAGPQAGPLAPLPSIIHTHARIQNRDSPAPHVVADVLCTALCPVVQQPFDGLSRRATVGFHHRTGFFEFRMHRCDARRRAEVSVQPQLCEPRQCPHRITQVSCDGASAPDTLSAVVVSAAGDPCDPAGLTAMGPCISGVDDLVWESSTLTHNTEYFLLIGTEHDPSDTVCTMFVELEGDGVTMDACCNHTLIPGRVCRVGGCWWRPGLRLHLDPRVLFVRSRNGGDHSHTG